MQGVLPTLVSRRSLIAELIRRELKLRYRGTWLGFLWTLVNPLVFTVVYTLVFAVYLRIGIPDFPAFLLCGLLPWIWFTESITSGTNCFVENAGFLRNAVFPVQVLPVVPVGAGMMNYIFSLPVLVGLLLVYGFVPGPTLIALPVIIAVQCAFATALLYFTATFNVFLRDLRYIVQHLLLLGFFLTPIMYDLSIVPDRFHWMLKLNPMTIVIDGYRSIFLFGEWPHWRNLALVLALAIVLFTIGTKVFNAKKELFAEYL